MKVYEDKAKEVVTRRECVKLTCDLCGSVADFPLNELWEWGGAGTASGKLEWHYSIDGECNSCELDLCFNCAQALKDTIKKQRATLLELIGRESEEEK